jgi:hypothetical protein
VGLESLISPLYELYWLLTTRHLTANTFSCIPIFLDNDFCKTINLFIIDICACSVYLEEKAPVKNKQTSINKNNHVNMDSVFSPSVLFPFCGLTGGGLATDLNREPDSVGLPATVKQVVLALSPFSLVAPGV